MEINKNNTLNVLFTDSEEIKEKELKWFDNIFDCINLKEVNYIEVVFNCDLEIYVLNINCYGYYYSFKDDCGEWTLLETNKKISNPYIEIPIYSEEINENGEYDIIAYRKEYIK